MNPKRGSCLKEIPNHPPQEGWRRGDPTRQNPAEPIKALAFNTLLSSQETDTHRAETRSHGPRPRGDSFFYSTGAAWNVNFKLFRQRRSDAACAASSGR